MHRAWRAYHKLKRPQPAPRVLGLPKGPALSIGAQVVCPERKLSTGNVDKTNPVNVESVSMFFLPAEAAKPSAKNGYLINESSPELPSDFAASLDKRGYRTTWY